MGDLLKDKQINEFSIAILLHTNNKIEEFYKENKFVAINSDGTMKKIEEKVCIEKKVRILMENIQRISLF